MKRIIFIIGVTLIGIWAAVFKDVFYGVLLYAFYSFASPLELTWGALEGMKFSFVVAGIVLTSALVQKQKLIPSHKITFLCILFPIFCYISLGIRESVSPYASYWIQLLSRTILMTLVAALLVDNAQKLRIYILAIAIFTGGLGAYYGIFGLLAGSTSISGPGRIGDNNGFAVWLNTALPFIYYGGLQLKNKSWRYLSKVFFGGTILAIVLTFSRGGFVTLVVVLALILFNIRKKVILFFLIIVASVSILFLASSDYSPSEDTSFMGEERSKEGGTVDKTLGEWRQRIETLREPTEKIASANSRIHFWKTAIDMANDNPLFGVGFSRYQNEYDNYDTLHGKFGGRRAVHNTLLKILAEIGYTGFAIFTILILACLSAGARAKKRMRKCEDVELKREFSDYVTMLRISIIAYFLGGFFVNALTHETFWGIVTISIVLDRVSETILEKSSPQSEDTINRISQRLFGK